MGNIVERDYGLTYGATLTLDVVRAWNSLQDFSSPSATDSSTSNQPIITLSRGLSEKEVIGKWLVAEPLLSS